MTVTMLRGCREWPRPEGATRRPRRRRRRSSGRPRAFEDGQEEEGQEGQAEGDEDARVLPRFLIDGLVEDARPPRCDSSGTASRTARTARGAPAVGSSRRGGEGQQERGDGLVPGRFRRQREAGEGGPVTPGRPLRLSQAASGRSGLVAGEAAGVMEGDEEEAVAAELVQKIPVRADGGESGGPSGRASYRTRAAAGRGPSGRRTRPRRPRGPTHDLVRPGDAVGRRPGAVSSVRMAGSMEVSLVRTHDRGPPGGVVNELSKVAECSVKPPAPESRAAAPCTGYRGRSGPRGPVPGPSSS